MHGRDGESGSGRIGSCKFASDWMGPGSAKRLGVVQDGAHHLLSRRVTAASFYEIYEWVVDDRSGRHVFIGVKLLLHYGHLQNDDIPEIATSTSLLVIVGVLAVTVVASVLKARRDPSVRAHAGSLRDTREEDRRTRRH